MCYHCQIVNIEAHDHPDNDMLRCVNAMHAHCHFLKMAAKRQDMEKILSIQSTVAVGFVGNRVAVPVITRSGHYPIAVDTMHLAAHPGHGVIAGGPPPIDQFSAILAALPQLDIFGACPCVITGYLGAVAQIGPIATVIDQWRDSRPAGQYILDPVLGDNGRIYVSDGLVQKMRARLLPRANYVTPNQFELGLLADRPVVDSDDASAAARQLLDQYPPLQAVIATGIIGDDGCIHDQFIGRDDTVSLAYSKRVAGIPGGGDLVTALFASHCASGLSAHDSFVAASRTAHKIIDASTSHLDIALLDHLDSVMPDA
jgi:pyridoxine kinase